MAKETMIYDFQIEQGDALDELEKTKKAILGLKEEQANLTKAYKAGNISLDEYSQGLVRVDNNLKVLNKEYSETQKKVTGVTSSFDKLNESNKNIADSLKRLDFGGVASGIGSATKAAIGFIATPLGAIIAAVGAAVGALTAYFRGSQEGQDRFNKLANIGSAILGKFGDIIQAVGKFIFDTAEKFAVFANKVLSFIPGFERFSKAVSDFLNLDNAEALSVMEKQRRELELQLITKRDQLKADIEAAKLRGESTRDAKERAAAFKEVEDKVKELFAQEKQLATLERDIAVERGKLANNTFEDNQKIEEAKARLAQLNREESAMLKENATKQLALNDARQKEIDLIKQKQSLAENERIQAQLDAQLAEEEAIRKSDEELARKAQAQLDAEEKMMLQQAVELSETESQERVTANFDAATKKRMASALERYKLEQQLIKQGLTQEEAAARIHQMIEQQKLAVTSDALGQASQLFKQNTVAYKVTATAKAVIDTYSAANLALSSYPPPLGAIFAALNIALGLINVAKITGISAAGGAKFMTKGPTLLLVGDNPGGKERVEVTPVSGRGTTRTWGNGAGIAMAGGGTVEGSILAAASTAPINSQFDLQNQLQNQPPVFVSWTEMTEFGRSVGFKEAMTQK